MQESLNPSKAHAWLDIVETVSVVGSIGGSIASIFINQAAVASIPLSITVMLNLVNRRLQLEAISKNNHGAVSQIMSAVEANNQQIAHLQQFTSDYRQVKSNVEEHSQQLQHNQTAMLQQSEINEKLYAINEQHNQTAMLQQSEINEKLYAINEQLTQSGRDFSQLQSDTQNYTEMLQNGQLEVAELLQGKVEVQATIESLTAQLVKIQEIIPSLIEGNSNLLDYAKLQSLYEEQMEVVKKVGYLREIDTSTQAIRIAVCDADAYYKRGLSFQALGDNQGSIGDFSGAIQLNSSHASAYYSRGLAHMELGNKKTAVQDLREAAKLFFEAGDITNYQMAKDSSKQIHELNSSVNAEAGEQVAVGSLFA